MSNKQIQPRIYETIKYVVNNLINLNGYYKVDFVIKDSVSHVIKDNTYVWELNRILERSN